MHAALLFMFSVRSGNAKSTHAFRTSFGEIEVHLPPLSRKASTRWKGSSKAFAMAVPFVFTGLDYGFNLLPLRERPFDGTRNERVVATLRQK